MFLALSASLPKAVSLHEARRVAARLNQEVANSVYSSRQLSRRLGLNRIAAQFGMKLSGSQMAGKAIDAQRATMLGERFSRFWVSKLTPANDGTLLAGKVEHRLVQIAVTEPVTAFDAERATAARHEVATRYKLAEVWDATLDKRTCPICESMHGEVAGPNGFSGGLRPGLHPHCRCQTHYEATASSFNLLPYIAAGATYGWM